MDNLVSIIVPVYNTDEYALQSCVESICKQTYEAIEIIIVDDGSNEVTRTICDNLLKKDERIKVYHKKNGGVSKARNYGTFQASGNYIMYVDSDDLRKVSQKGVYTTITNLLLPFLFILCNSFPLDYSR